MMTSIRQKMTQRPVWWPVAGVVATIVFFTSYLAIGTVVMELLIPPNPEKVTVFAFQDPVPKVSLMYSSLAIIVSYLGASATYARLRGESAVNALARNTAMFLKLGIGYPSWMAILFGLLWLTGQGGAVGVLGVILLVMFGLVSIGLFASHWEKNTPPYPEATSDEK